MALEMRTACEKCSRAVAPESTDVFICSFECTFCRECTEQTLRHVCPNCGGELLRRPVRCRKV